MSKQKEFIIDYVWGYQDYLIPKARELYLIPRARELVEGLVNFLDYIQDEAAKQIGNEAVYESK